MRIEYHRTLVADTVRNTAFRDALARVIVPGRSTVADIGAGTGLIGFMAARLGAKEVTLYEMAEVAQVARKLARLNGLKNCRVVPAHSLEVERPRRADIVVSETLGNHPFEEHIIETMNDARERYLAVGGVLIPTQVEQHVAPVVAEGYWRELAVWDSVGRALDMAVDMAPARAMSLNNMYVRSFSAADLLNDGNSARVWDSAEFARSCASVRKGEAEWRMERPITVYGFASWWVAELVPGVRLATGPLDARTHWEQLYLPVLEPVRVAAGETLAVRIRSATSHERGTEVTWTAVRKDSRGREVERQRMELAKGYLP